MTQRGGKRPNAGRKPGSSDYGENTVVMRVPASQKPLITKHLVSLIQQRRQQALQNVVEITELLIDENASSLPLYTSKVAAGLPSPADEHIEKRLNPNHYLVENDNSTFFVRVKGDSMIDAGIFEDDVLVVDRSRVPQIGDIVLALLDAEFTVKTLGRSRHGTRLLPANKNYPVIEVKEEQSFEVWGVITGSMRKFK